MTESYQDKLDNFSWGKSFVKLRGGVRNATGELCEACGSGQPGTLFGIRELLTGLDHFVGYNCLRELMRKKAVLQGRVRETTEDAFGRAQRIKERSGNGQFNHGHAAKPASDTKVTAQQGERKVASGFPPARRWASPCAAPGPSGHRHPHPRGVGDRGRFQGRSPGTGPEWFGRRVGCR